LVFLNPAPAARG